ncbi:hypothetical protein [Luteimonas sp. e5]
MNLQSAPHSRGINLSIFAALALAMVATRLHHFAVVPDASWAVFFAGGFWLRHATRWAFPALMLLAVAVDWFVISRQGISFWSHYCVSPGYWMLLPAYFSLWAGGMWLSRQSGSAPLLLAKAAGALFVAVAVCQLFSQGGFYWLSDAVANKSLAGWAKNYNDWLWPFLGSTAMYVALAAVAHFGIRALATPRHEPVARA